MATAFQPDWCIAPAATLQEWMGEMSLSVPVLAVACAGRERRDEAVKAIQAVLDREPLTEVAAGPLERGTGVTRRFWLALEHNYRAGLAAGLIDATDS